MNIKTNLYRIIENKLAVILILATITIIFGIIGFGIIEHKNFYETIMGIVDLFVFESIDKYNGYIFLGRIFALMTMFFGVISFFIYRFSNTLVVSTIVKKTYSLVVGLGENNRHYLNSETDNSKNIIVIEKDSNNPHIDRYIAKGFGIKIGDIFDSDSFEKLHLNNLSHAIISTGSDRRNLEVLVRMIDYFDNSKHKRLYVHLEDFLLKSLFTEEIIQHQNSEIVTFSFYELAVQKLLMEHSILGDKPEIANSSEPFSIAIIGSGDLALQLVYQLSNIAHLPNENRLTIYCIDKNAKQFIQRVKQSFTYIDQIPTIELKAIRHDILEPDFYQQEIWHEPNLTNIIITKKDETNLNIALDFYNKCYIKSIGEGRLKTKILLASYKHRGLCQTINSNRDKFKQFYTFANASDIFKKETLLNEELDRIAKLIHRGYGELYNPDLLFSIEDTEIDRKWFQNSSLNDKISNRMQGMHLDIKLLAMGLKKVKSNKSAKKLLEINQKIFREKLGLMDISDEELFEFSKELTKAYNGEDFKVLYFPQKFDTLFERLIRSEHNRWNAYHYLHGWRYNKIKNKTSKEHNCLLPLDRFDTRDIKLTIIYDIYSILYIPNLLASVGYEIVALETILKN